MTSRRGAEALLIAGRVTVDGRVRLEPGAQADPALQRICVDGRPVPAAAPHRYIVLHKPRGVVTTRRDPEGRPLVMDLLPPGLRHLVPVGRLDADAEGLLMLTNDGDLGHRLLHPRFEVPRVYEVEVRGRVGEADLPRWRRGATLADGPARPRAVTVTRASAGRTRLVLTFAEGRKHEVKRYCTALGHPVLRLVRVAFGPLALGGLQPGRWRDLTPAETARLKGLQSP